MILYRLQPLPSPVQRLPLLGRNRALACFLLRSASRCSWSDWLTMIRHLPMMARQRFAIVVSLLLMGIGAPTASGQLVSHSFSVQVVAVDEGITEIAPFDFYEIAFTINQNVTDPNSSPSAGTFPGLATAFSLAARPLNALPWHPMGTFDLGAASNFVDNAFGNNYTFQVRGSGFPDGGPGLALFDLDLRWTWPGRVAPGRCRPGAPTDPYVRTLPHTVPQSTGSLSLSGPRSYSIKLR